MQLLNDPRDDAADTGGYFVLLTRPDRAQSYDDWVPDRASLGSYFHEAGWQIDWADVS